MSNDAPERSCNVDAQVFPFKPTDFAGSSKSGEQEEPAGVNSRTCCCSSDELSGASAVAGESREAQNGVCHDQRGPVYVITIPAVCFNKSAESACTGFYPNFNFN